MKRIVFALVACVVMFASCEIKTTSGPSASQVVANAEDAAKDNAVSAQTSTPVPQLSYFQERKTIAKWAARWDKPSVPTYVYLVSFGKIIGYYVADGKPASTRSYLTPEEQSIYADLGEYHGDMLVPAPDIDGCYGDNNQGIRFFTAEGVAVEWAGDSASYLYSDAPIDFGYFVPRLNTGK